MSRAPGRIRTTSGSLPGGGSRPSIRPSPPRLLRLGLGAVALVPLLEHARAVVGGDLEVAVGYESDEDLDNGVRPAGLMHLSTTTGPTEQYVQNAGGNIVLPGTTTHNLTLYRVPSGALVFGAGTVQWGWGLDQYHDGDNSDPQTHECSRPRLNMLADMSALPTTLMSGLVMPVKTTDSTAPTVTITTPATGASLASGTQLTSREPPLPTAVWSPWSKYRPMVGTDTNAPQERQPGVTPESSAGLAPA